jgi:NAD+ diphosphatase
VCEQGHEEFPRTDPAVIVLVHDGADKMVLARQPIWPPGWVSVLAGFVEAGESLEMTVAREIKEEVGLDVDQITYLTSQPWPAPRSLMLGFAARANPDQPLQPREGEIEQAHWVTREEVRRMLGEEAMDMSAQPTGSAERKMLPGAVSIARKLIEGWAALD